MKKNILRNLPPKLAQVLGEVALKQTDFFWLGEFLENI